MSYKVRGKIKSISKIEDAGAGKKLSFRIDNGETYSNIMEFELYKGAEYLEHLDNFSKYNKVGDSVDVEFNIKTFNWKPEAEDKIFTSLSCWKVEKGEAVNGVPTVPQPTTNNDPSPADDLPF
jgi:hypothetical protein